MERHNDCHHGRKQSIQRTPIWVKHYYCKTDVLSCSFNQAISLSLSLYSHQHYWVLLSVRALTYFLDPSVHWQDWNRANGIEHRFPCLHGFWHFSERGSDAERVGDTVKSWLIESTNTAFIWTPSFATAFSTAIQTQPRGRMLWTTISYSFPPYSSR